MSHWRHRSDANTVALVEVFEKLGWLVHRNNGAWDLTIAKPNQPATVRLIEVKDPNSTNLKRKNSGDKLIASGFPIIRCLTIDDCVAVK